MADTRKSISDLLLDASSGPYTLQDLRDIIASQGGHLQASTGVTSFAIGTSAVQLVGLDTIDLAENMDDSIWDIVTNCFHPEYLNSRYILRLSITIDPPGGAKTLVLQCDIGDQVGVSNVIYEQIVTTTASQTAIVYSIPLYCLQTFVDNGCRFFFTGSAAYEILSARLVVFRI